MSDLYCFKPEEEVSDSFQAFLVEGACFTSQEEYPVIESGMVSCKLPETIMPFNKAINFQGDLSHTFICFYSPDESFERVRRNPRRYVSFFKRTAGIIGLDFSIHSDMPTIKQKSQINDNLSLTYYYGKQGIPIIPNLRCGSDELIVEFLHAIPKRQVIAIGTHGFIKTRQEMYEWYCFIEKIIAFLKPPAIVVYGHLTNHMFDELKNRTSFTFYEPWIYTHGMEVKAHVN